MRRAERAFTLLEVLAAVALLAVLYTVLATTATRGLRGEGESRRRLEASLRADEALAEVETSLALGEAPDLGSDEQEDDFFTVRTEVTAFELPVPPLEGEEPPGRGEPTLFPESRAGAESPVRRIDITVSWLDAGQERSVVRTTFGLDLNAASDTLAVIAPESGPPQ